MYGLFACWELPVPRSIAVLIEALQSLSVKRMRR
jgi:hypothetical protein